MAAPLDPTIDLVVPARNEAVNIPSLLESIPWSMLRHVVVVDNGSTDQTAWTARQGGAIVIQEKRRGYGSACLAGLAWIADCDEPPDLVGFVDADLADDPRHLVDLSRPITNGTADLVIACRQLHAEKGALTATQRFLSSNYKRLFSPPEQRILTTGRCHTMIPERCGSESNAR